MTSSFYLTVAARFTLMFAVQMQAVLLGWQIYDLTKDPLSLGLVGLAEAIPALSLALVAGYITDRMNPKYLYQGVLITSLVSILVSLFAKDANDLYVAALITGFGRSFAGPTMQAIVPRIVRRDQLNVASAWTTSAVKLASVSGPAIAGLLLAWKGLSFSYATAATVISVGVISLFFVNYPHVKNVRPADAPKMNILDEMLAGLRFVFGHRILLSVLALDMFAVLFGGVTAILPVYAVDILNVGPEGLGMLRASAAIGALLTTVWLIKNPISKNAGQILLQVVAGFGVSILVFAVSKNIYLSCFALAVGGSLDSVSMVIRAAIVQLCSPDHMRGRIASVNSIFIGSSNELGAFRSGLTTKLMGTVPSAVFGGIMTLVTVFFVWRLAPEVKKIDMDRL